MSLVDAALEWDAAGFSVIPIRADGTKSPAVTWKPYQSRKPTHDEIREWFGDERPRGIAVVCGAVSGNVEMLEFEGRAVAAKKYEQVRAELGAELWTKVTRCWEQSPSGGWHFFYRVDGVAAEKNTKLARRPGDEGGVDVLVETRGEGGFVIVAPSRDGVHPTGRPWRFLGDSKPSTLPTITAGERDRLYAAARALDEMPEPEPAPERPAARIASDGLAPGEDFNNRATWEELLEPGGWQRNGVQANGGQLWTRPGKDVREGVSAVTGGDVGDLLWVWSTSTEFPSEESMSKFGVYALLFHAGDFAAAASALRQQGYGGERETRISDDELFANLPKVRPPRRRG